MLQARYRLPELFILVWIAFLAFTIWSHVKVCNIPPIMDAYSYYYKAYQFWQAVYPLHWFNPLNLEPSFRPPGTVLMSYPFGFQLDFHGFYFRSVFLPAMLLIMAVYVISYNRFSHQNMRSYVALIAAFFSTFSLIYQFQVLGMVDNFLAGFAALTAAFAYRSIEKKSLYWVFITAILSSVCMVIKPAGVLVAAIIGIFWVALCLFQMRINKIKFDLRNQTFKFYVSGFLILIVIDLALLFASFHSAYLSSINLHLGGNNIAIMKEDFATPSFMTLLWLIPYTFGISFALWMMGAGISFMTNWFHDSLVWRQIYSFSFLMGVATLIFGLWFLFFGSGGGLSVARYGAPFMMVGMIWMVPIMIENRFKVLTILFSILMLIAIISLAILLIQKQPSPLLQKIVNVNLNIKNTAHAEIYKNIANRPRVTNETIYFLEAGESDQFTTAYTDQYNFMHPGKPQIRTMRPQDWIRHSTYYISEIINSAYIDFYPNKYLHADKIVDTREKEFAALNKWASGLTTKDGVELYFNSPTERILHVTDTKKLHNSILNIIPEYQWRDVFKDANREIFPLQKFDMDKDIAQNGSLIENIRFGHAFIINHVSVIQNGNKCMLRVWWQPLENNTQGWFFFVRSLDKTAKIIDSHQINLVTINGKQKSQQFYVFQEEIKASKHIGIGIANIKEQLIADKGNRLFGGRIVILKVALHKKHHLF